MGLELCHHVCLDILFLVTFCFVFPPSLRVFSSCTKTPQKTHGDHSHGPSCFAAPRAVLSPVSQSVSLLQAEPGLQAVRAVGKAHTAKFAQSLWGRELCLQGPRKSPGFLISLATAVCACSLPPPRPVGWRWGNVKWVVGGSAGRHPLTTRLLWGELCFPSGLAQAEWFDAESCASPTSCFIRLFSSSAVHG